MIDMSKMDWTLEIRNLTEWEGEKILEKVRAVIGKPRTEMNSILTDEGV